MRAAESLKASMDTSVDPCNDFYTFACGGFNSKAVIEDDKTSYTTFTVIRNKLEVQVSPLHLVHLGGSWGGYTVPGTVFTG